MLQRSTRLLNRAACRKGLISSKNLSRHRALSGVSGSDAAPEPHALFGKLDIRVGLIVEAWPHPESDKLYCERIDVGEDEGPREIASGLQQHYDSAEQLTDRKVLVVCNLKPAKVSDGISSRSA